MQNKLLNTFEGNHAVLDFLNPDNAPYMPLVELPRDLNPFRDKGVRVFVKLMNMLPLANIKSLPAYNMLLDKKVKGELTGIKTIIENSSGNTVFSLAVIARLIGIPHTKAIVSHEVTRGKLDILRFLGTEIVVNKEPICPDPSDPTSGIYKARVWAKENNWFNPGQYDNEANPEAHEKWTAPQIWEQTRGKVDILCVGLGTTGTVTGMGRYLKAKNKDIKIVGVSRKPNNPVPGVRTSNLLKGIAFNWRDYVDREVEVGTVESFKKSLELCRSGIMVGPSSGFALVGLMNYLKEQKFDDENSKNKDKEKNKEKNKEKIAVVVCPDSPFPYIDEYFECLHESEFPEIENEHLLQHKPPAHKKEMADTVREIDAIEAYKILSSDKSENIMVIDLRTKREFEEHHIHGAEHVAFHDIDARLKSDRKMREIRKMKKMKKAKLVLFVCKFGNMSRLATWKAARVGIKAASLKGGDAEWSRLNLPRIRANACVERFDLN